MYLLQIANGYFTHFFAPSGLGSMGKDILFILDISGSMGGRKTDQVQAAMEIILDDLRPEDMFNIAVFNSATSFWRKSMVSVNQQHIASAKKFINRIDARGSKLFCKKLYHL